MVSAEQEARFESLYASCLPSDFVSLLCAKTELAGGENKVKSAGSLFVRVTNRNRSKLSVLGLSATGLAMTRFLPQDLEREIFEFSALSNPRSIPKSVLVARHVKNWIESLLYRTLSVVNEDQADSDAVDLIRISASICLATAFHAVLTGLTHLDMFETSLSENWATDICSLPRLTHLSFNTDDVEPFAPETQIRYILANSKSLEAFYFSDDPRSVVMSVADSGYLVDWERGGTEGDDYWIQAEIFIQKRRSGEIKGLGRTIVEMIRVCGANEIDVVDLQPACFIPTKDRSPDESKFYIRLGPTLVHAVATGGGEYRSVIGSYSLSALPVQCQLRLPRIGLMHGGLLRPEPELFRRESILQFGATPVVAVGSAATKLQRAVQHRRNLIQILRRTRKMCVWHTELLARSYAAVVTSMARRCGPELEPELPPNAYKCDKDASYAERGQASPGVLALGTLESGGHTEEAGSFKKSTARMFCCKDPRSS
ncbi:hypothetical protein DFH08DRAFT_942291 [Mycena albidolilacea]|uniref:Uncharacterized protein n=1 Tax=Mycena albidolilacea TaxID=1033008 RepID=A0AAD7EGK2_9AGAR|nr:hypothetical protein DFH08DRAFT_942291 [Mycena albidolilacea]